MEAQAGTLGRQRASRRCSGNDPLFANRERRADLGNRSALWRVRARGSATPDSQLPP